MFHYAMVRRPDELRSETYLYVDRDHMITCTRRIRDQEPLALIIPISSVTRPAHPDIDYLKLLNTSISSAF